jgi:hypothetical protein
MQIKRCVKSSKLKQDDGMFRKFKIAAWIVAGLYWALDVSLVVYFVSLHI